MCTSHSHYIREGGNCLCGAIKNGEYSKERDFLKRNDVTPALFKEQPKQEENK